MRVWLTIHSIAAIILHTLPIFKTHTSNTDDFNPTLLLKLARYQMPYGKYKGRYLVDLPEPYVVWLANKGFPRGELGDMLGLIYEVKVNGLEYLLKPLIKNEP